MLLPALFLIHSYSRTHPLPSSISQVVSNGPMLGILATCCHAPVSFIYHIRCAHSMDSSRLHNIWRRLDQSVMHCVIIVFSFVFSNSLLYTFLVFFPNAWAISCIFGIHGLQLSHGFPVQAKILPLVVLYLLPIVYHGDTRNFLSACFWGFLSFLLFLTSKHIEGWGHAVFHILTVPYSLALLRAAIIRAEE